MDAAVLDRGGMLRLQERFSWDFFTKLCYTILLDEDPGHPGDTPALLPPPSPDLTLAVAPLVAATSSPSVASVDLAEGDCNQMPRKSSLG